jgi:cell division protein FtsL
MKNSKPLIGYLLTIGIVVTLYLLGYVSVKLKCESLIKQKVMAEESLSSARNWKLNLTAQYQYLNSAERIVEIAGNELGMVKDSAPVIKLTVSSDKIESVQKEINAKYE